MSDERRGVTPGSAEDWAQFVFHFKLSDESYYRMTIEKRYRLLVEWNKDQAAQRKAARP